jgi:outer membrane protein TolC
MIYFRVFYYFCFILAIALSIRSVPVSVAAAEADDPVLRLSLNEIIAMVHQRNERIHYQKLDWDISLDAVKNAESMFEPEMVASYSHVKNKVLNTSTERASQDPISFLFGSPAEVSEYNERNNEYSMALESVVPTGAKVRLGYDLRDLSNSVMRTSDEYKSFLGGSIVQPLLKNAGIEVTMANIRVAEADADMSLQGYRREMLQVVAEAAAAYWNLSLAQEKLKVRRESVRIAAEILHDNRERVRTGKMAETEVLEAEAGLALRKSMETAAKQELNSAINSIKTLFSSSSGEMDLTVIATDELVPRQARVDFESSYRESLKMRPEYVSTIKKAEREGIRVAYAENQRWPQLDLKASYGINGLDTREARDARYLARNRDYESWSVGLELRIPIMGGQKTKSELAAAKKRKQQTLLELKATEVALANAVDTSIKNVRNALSQAGSYAEAVRLNERLLEVELARLNAGLSNSRLVLDRDEELNRAKEYYLESLVNFEKASVALEAVKGTLLRNHGIEVMEES